MSSHTLHTEIEIAAPPERVWTVLTAFDQWPEWNRLLAGLKLQGPLREGTPGQLMIKLGPRLGTRGIGIRMVTVLQNCEIAWVGGVPGLMKGLHGFRMDPIDRGTRLIHTETFSGALAGVFIRLAEQKMYQRYRTLNESLRDRCEQP